MFLYAFLFLFFSYYVVKMELILRLIENGVYSHNRILFKVMIFLYFNFYRGFFSTLIIRYFKLCKQNQIKQQNEGILMLLKFFLSDLMCSCLVPVIVYNKDNFIIIISIFLFSYQITIIYLKNNFIFEYLIKIGSYVFNFKQTINDDIWQNKCRNMMIKVLNEVLVIIYFKILIINFTKKFTIRSIFMSFLSDNCFFFNSKMHIYVETMVLLIALNGLIFGSFYCSRETKHQDFNLNEKTQLLKKIYHNVMIYSYVELNYQFYFYLSSHDS